MSKKWSLLLAVSICATFAVHTSSLFADDTTSVGPDPQMYEAMVGKAIEFLEKSQLQNGSLSSQIGIGPTALATLGRLQCGQSPDDPKVVKALDYLEQYTQESGGIHAPGTFITTYETCIALVCFQKANRDGKYDKIIERAEKFIRGEQWDEAKDKKKSDLFYGGTGYGGRTRPDASNTAFFVEALKTCGAEDDDPDIQKAMIFLSRCQNLESSHNTTEFASKINDGGFFYTCVVGAKDKDRMTANGGLRSYGSMTYSGLKSMIYAGLSEDDPRVKAAIQWLRTHYDMKTNPGMGDAGLFYYYHTIAKALDALGVDIIEDAKGVKHDWRRELAEELARRQRPNGSWINANTRWMEGDPNLSTAFALLSLSYCKPKAGKE